ncbi:hypothetical protein PTKIN_Ptkin08bG0208600 [Pterospermum kingtungense]
MSIHMSYNRVGRRYRGSKGFRLNIPRRFSVQGLRARFFYIFRLLSRWRSSALRLIIRKVGMNRSGNLMMKRNNSSSRGSRRSLVMPKEVNGCRLRSSSLGRSNSFYSEAIADCLEFIKRSSQKQPVPAAVVCQR